MPRLIADAAGRAVAARNAHRSRRKPEVAELGEFAGRHGLRFATDDLFVLHRYGFFLFRKGVAPLCEHQLHGTWRGVPVVAADLRQQLEFVVDSGRRGKPSPDYWSVVVVELDVRLPTVIIRKKDWVEQKLLGPPAKLFRPVERFMDRAMGSQFGRMNEGRSLVELDSSQFNDLVEVSAHDEEFAQKLIDAPMRDWLSGPAAPYSFEVLGSDVLAYCKRVRPTQLAPLFDAAVEFVERIPTTVKEQYGTPAAR